MQLRELVQVLKRDGQPIAIRDYDDDGYIKNLQLRELATSVGIVLKSLGPEQLEVREQKKDEGGQQYYLALLDEMSKAGLDLGMFARLSQAAKALSRPVSNPAVLLMQQALGTKAPDDDGPIDPLPGEEPEGNG